MMMFSNEEQHDLQALYAEHQKRISSIGSNTANFTEAYEAPVNETERRLARIWEELFGLERVGRSDRFLALGKLTPGNAYAFQSSEDISSKGFHRTIFQSPDC